MAKTRQQKTQAIGDLETKLQAKGVVFFNHTGLKVLDLEILRKAMRTDNGRVVVAKRNLLLKAAANVGVTLPADQLTGAIAMATADDDILPAKVVANFKKTHEAVQLVGGLLEQQFINQQQVAAMAKLPGKSELIAAVVGTIKAPLSGLANVLAANLRGLVTTLKAIQEQKV
ncbi:MAG: 50S ribosomal protein L10 [Candidatus Kerfeldbacteria bacterium]|nr:50S ribosomal protein L10 [Candidatus Kerfeldbacteria bacterium]